MAALELTWWPPLVILLALGLAGLRLDPDRPQGSRLPDDLAGALRRWLAR